MPTRPALLFGDVADVPCPCDHYGSLRRPVPASLPHPSATTHSAPTPTIPQSEHRSRRRVHRLPPAMQTYGSEPEPAPDRGWGSIAASPWCAERSTEPTKPPLAVARDGLSMVTGGACRTTFATGRLRETPDCRPPHLCDEAVASLVAADAVSVGCLDRVWRPKRCAHRSAWVAFVPTQTAVTSAATMAYHHV